MTDTATTYARAVQDAPCGWTTRIDPKFTALFGVDEIHQVCFEPAGWPGKGAVVSLGIPECELQYVYVGDDGAPEAVINRPQVNRNVKCWTHFACEVARKRDALLFFSCDTTEQAASAAKRAAKWLPRHRRAAQERVFADPKFRAAVNLS